MIGIKDIAKKAGVSVSTVSNVLNGKKNVGEETRKRILSLCMEMDYHPNMAGKSLKTGDNRTILFNFSDFDHSYFLKIINGINDYVSNNGYDLLICTNNSCEKYMRSNLTRGCIIFDGRIKTALLEKTARENYPIVVLDRIVDHPYIKSVIINNYDPMKLMMEGLVQRGYTKFGFIGGPEQSENNKERYSAFLDVLNEHNISFHRKNYFSGDWREKSGITAAKIFMLSDYMPEILVCANDNMAIGAMKTFRKNDLRVPEDIALTGFNNSNLAEVMGLTTVDIPDYERGYIAAQSIIENINGHINTETFRITAQVKFRKSILEKKS